jgi:glutamate/tyrosine decarboxylase-like PLP-dependent enzyme
MVVGTAGTTSAGAIDPLTALADQAGSAGAWFHVDAAYGGIAALSDRLRPALYGIERADSVTWDAHKCLPVPLGAGMFFCRHPEAVHRAFSVRSSCAPGSVRDTVDPFLTTAQWSRRFIGVAVFAVLAELGAPGVAALVERQADLAGRLRVLLAERGFLPVNATPLPVVCFTHPRIKSGETTTHAVVKAVRATGEAWISPVRLGAEPVMALRACVTNCRTREEDLTALLDLVDGAVQSSSR